MNFETDGSDWPNRDASRFVTAAGFTWHVQIFGQGPPLLLVHGTGASGHSWRQIAPLLSPHYQLVIPDLPGHGFTDTPSAAAFTLPGMAAALAGLMAELAIVPHLCMGHSAGAAVLIQMAIDGRLAPRAIISVNGALLPFQGMAGQIFSPLAKLLFLNPWMPRVFAWRAHDRTAVARLLRGTGSNVEARDIELYGRLFSSPKHCHGALAMMARWDLETFETLLPRCAVPLILIAAEHDLAIRPADAHRVAARVAGARVVPVPGAGHLAHEEKPESVARIVLAADPAAAQKAQSRPSAGG